MLPAGPGLQGSHTCQSLQEQLHICVNSDLLSWHAGDVQTDMHAMSAGG